MQRNDPLKALTNHPVVTAGLSSSNTLASLPCHATRDAAQADSPLSYKLRVITGGGRGEGADGEAVQVAVVGASGTTFLRRIPAVPESGPSSARLFNRGSYDTARAARVCPRAHGVRRPPSPASSE